MLASDGLWDNMFDVRLIELMRPFIRDTDDLLDPHLIAEIIAKETEKLSYDMNYMSPFSKGAKDHYYDYLGGKPDDITIIVA